MGRNKLHVATTPPSFAKLGHVHPFRFTPESPDKTRRSVSMSSGGSALEGKVQIHVHKVRKCLMISPASEVQEEQRNKALTPTVPGIKEQRQGFNSRSTLCAFFLEHRQSLLCQINGPSWEALCLTQEIGDGLSLEQVTWTIFCSFVFCASPSIQNCCLGVFLRHNPI